MRSLFILGNGFDLAHGMPTRYSDFRKYLVSSYPDIAEYKNYCTDMFIFNQITLVITAVLWYTKKKRR